MAEAKRSLLANKGLRIVTLVLLLQAVAFYAFSKTEYIPQPPPLAAFPIDIGPWQLIQETPVEKEVVEVLRSDDTLNRTYARSGAVPMNLFIAAFRSQRNGKTPHSPKNCLPGAGWVQSVNDRIPVELPGAGTQLVNHYVVSKGDAKSVVLYWYQSRDRVVASEWSAKFYVIADSIRYNRTDTALVRIVVPVGPGGQAEADREAVEFAKAAFPSISRVLPQ